MATIVMNKNKVRENFEFVVYNYLASERKITFEKLQKDFKERYDIDLILDEVNEIISEYVKSGVLSQRLSFFIFKNN